MTSATMPPETFMNEQSNTAAEVYYAVLREEVHWASSGKVVRVLVQRHSIAGKRVGPYIDSFQVKQRATIADLLAVNDHAEDLSVYFHLAHSTVPAPVRDWFEVAPESYSSYPPAQKAAMSFAFSRVAFCRQDPGCAVVYCIWAHGEIRRRQRGGPEQFEPLGWVEGKLVELRRAGEGWEQCGDLARWSANG